MSGRAKNLADRFNSFNEEVVSFVEECGENDWDRIGSEGWPVGVTALHIGAVHYWLAAVAAKKILGGEALPDITMDQITENANRYAREHAGCTKAEVLNILRENGRKLVEFAGALEDRELDMTGYLPASRREMTVERFLEDAILESAGDHFKSIRAAAGK